MFGSDVVPFTPGKAGLLVTVLQLLEGDTADMHRHFRITKISHSPVEPNDIGPYANVSVVILRSKDNKLQGLDQVKATY